MEFNGTFLATIITFILFVFLMNKVLYVPILGIMEKRQRFIDENYQTASENEEKAQNISSEIEEKLGSAKSDARNKYLDVLNIFKKQKSEAVSEAQHKVNEKLDTSKAELENLSNEVKEGLKSKMTDLANDIVEKILGYRSEIQNFDDSKVNDVLYK